MRCGDERLCDAPGRKGLLLAGLPWRSCFCSRLCSGHGLPGTLRPVRIGPAARTGSTCLSACHSAVLAVLCSAVQMMLKVPELLSSHASCCSASTVMIACGRTEALMTSSHTGWTGVMSISLHAPHGWLTGMCVVWSTRAWLVSMASPLW